MKLIGKYINGNYKVAIFDDDGTVETTIYNSSYRIDISRKRFENCFKTYEEAEEILEEVKKVFTQNKGE